MPKAAAPETVVPSEAPAESQEPRIRGVLARFAAAYSSLSAADARAVWPTVDQRALARAFASLASQRVSLGQCSILATGSSGRADCLGTFTWTPKVGAGTRTLPRRWSFDLTEINGEWKIVRAEAR